jgi:hypothetical protein
MMPSMGMDNSGTGDQEKDKGKCITVYCRLFSDFVPMETCARRKQELNPFGWNSCNGCVIGLLQNWVMPDGEGLEQRIA